MAQLCTSSETNAAEARAFLLAVVALGSGVFTLAFWFGVFQTVFFENLFLIWVASTGSLLASFFVPSVDATPTLKSPIGRSVLLLPSVWLALEALGQTPALLSPGTDWVLLAITCGVVLVTFPFIIYVLILVTVPDVEHIKQPRLQVALVAIVLLVGAVGLGIGKHHPRFVSCEEFKVAGDDVPDNCAPQRHLVRLQLHGAGRTLTDGPEQKNEQ